MTENFKLAADIISVIANISATIASCIAIYLFLTKREEISTAFKILFNWTFQTTLSDLKAKIERLNEYNAGDATDITEIKNILNEISGQIKGNTRLHNAEPELANRLESLANSKKLSEPSKRSMVAEMREKLRNIEVNSMKN